MEVESGIKTGNFREVEELAGIGYWKHDVADETSEYSESLCGMLGLSKKQATRQTMRSLVHQDDVGELLKAFEQIRQSPAGMVIDLKYRINKIDGVHCCFRSVFKKFDLDGREIILGITSDITRFTEKILPLHEKNHQLEQLTEELASFNYAASHDLQEPLRKIQMYISRLEEEIQLHANPAADYFYKTAIAARRMQQLINDLLFYFQPDYEVKIIRINLADPLQEALQEVSLQARSKDAVIETCTLPVLPVVPFQIRQLFINLISNALKYSKNNRRPLIQISCAEMQGDEIGDSRAGSQKGYYRISVADNGIGFRQEYSEKLFALFHRLHKKDKYEGTGIGLAICKKVMDNHDGFIDAKGRPGKGATFNLYFPMA